jgi:hypothetical protein
MTPAEFDYAMAKIPSFKQGAEWKYHPACLAAKLQGCGAICEKWCLGNSATVAMAIKAWHGVPPSEHPGYRALGDPDPAVERERLQK